MIQGKFWIEKRCKVSKTINWPIFKNLHVSVYLCSRTTAMIIKFHARSGVSGPEEESYCNLGRAIITTSASVVKTRGGKGKKERVAVNFLLRPRLPRSRAPRPLPILCLLACVWRECDIINSAKNTSRMHPSETLCLTHYPVMLSAICHLFFTTRNLHYFNEVCSIFSPIVPVLNDHEKRKDDLMIASSGSFRGESFMTGKVFYKKKKKSIE